MAKKSRSSAISDALTGQETEHSWKNQFSDGQSPASQDAPPPGDSSKAGRYKRKTYLMTEDLIKRVEDQAQAQQVGVNEMARYCLNLALTLIESGEHKPEIQEVTTSKRTLGI